MKKLSLIPFSFILFFVGFSLQATAVEYRWKPPSSIDQPLGQLMIISQSEALYQLPQINGISWQGERVSQSYRNINGNVSIHRSVNIPFKVERAGTFEIPSFEITESSTGKKVRTKALHFKVGGSAYADKMYMELDFPKKVWAGEQFTFRLFVYLDPSFRLAGAPVPKLNIPGLKIKTFNREQGFEQIADFKNGEATYKNKRKTVLVYDFVATALLSGEYSASVDTVVALRQLPRGGFGFSQHISVPLKAQAKKFVIKELPLPPKDGYNLNLIGDCQLSGKFDRTELPEGHLFSLNVNMKFKGDASRLQPPRIEIPGFQLRKVEPKIDEKEKSSHILISYIFSPESVNSQWPEELKFYSFNPEKGEYTAHPLNLKLKVTPSQIVSSQPQNSSPSLSPKPSAGKLESRGGKKFSERPFVFSRGVFTAARHPLSRVNPFLLWLSLIVPLFTAFLFWRRRQLNPRLQLRSRILATLKKAGNLPEEKARVFIEQELLPQLREWYELPGSAGLLQIAEKSDNEHLLQTLKEWEDSRFSPGNKAVAIGRWLPQLRRLLLSSLLFLSLSLGAQPEDETPPRQLPSTEQTSIDANEDLGLLYNEAQELIEEKNYATAHSLLLRLVHRETLFFPAWKDLFFCREKLGINGFENLSWKVISPYYLLNCGLVFWLVFWLAICRFRKGGKAYKLCSIGCAILASLFLLLGFYSHYSRQFSPTAVARVPQVNLSERPGGENKALLLKQQSCELLPEVIDGQRAILFKGKKYYCSESDLLPLY